MPDNSTIENTFEMPCEPTYNAAVRNACFGLLLTGLLSIALGIELGAQASSLAPVPVPEDFKTVDGKEYKDATVSRVEPDGLVLTTKFGISKVYFVELPKEVQERFHYDAAKAAQFTTVQQASIAESNVAVAAQQQQKAQERQRQAAAIAQQRQQAQEQQRQADAIAMQQEAQQAQQQQRYALQQQHKAAARQAAEQWRLRQVAGAAASQRAQEDQRIDRENRRNLENMQREQALWNQQQRVEWARQHESRESYKRELEQQKQLHWGEGNSATAY